MAGLDPGALGWLTAAVGLAVSVSKLLDWASSRLDRTRSLHLGEMERIAADRNSLFALVVEERDRLAAERDHAERERDDALARAAAAEDEARRLRFQLWRHTGGPGPVTPDEPSTP